jgi:hypothetical protein
LNPKEAAILRLRFGLVNDVLEDPRYEITPEDASLIASGQGLK